jgi:hypothetical protein
MGERYKRELVGKGDRDSSVNAGQVLPSLAPEQPDRNIGQMVGKLDLRCSVQMANY